MALTVGDRPVHPLTADDVMEMVRAGIIGEDDPVELLHGVLTEVSPKSARHGTVIARISRWLNRADATGRYEVRTEHPVLVPDRFSLPEPDVAVVAPGVAGEHPTTARLLVEVAVSSLRTDLEVKAPLYAAARVPEYWVVDVPGRRVHVLTGPDRTGYARHDEITKGSVVPGAVEAEPLHLAALFAGLR